MSQEAERDDAGEAPPLGSWPRIYAAVIVCAVLSMALIGLFSAWKY